METLSAARCFDGRQLQLRHRSEACDCDMTFSVFLPPQAERGPVPVVWWLSGLTCTDQNFVTKAGAQRYAAEHGLALVAPDTSPRGEQVPGDPDGRWDFGLGAGFYVDATEAPWSRNYRMYTYVTEELPALVFSEFPVDRARQGISGHSMGGHGALVVALRNPGRFRSVSAFAPICAPSEVPWGIQAFSRFLGPDRSTWAAWDASALVASAPERLPILVDQGSEDGFLATQLRPERLEEAARAAGHPVEVRRRPGYDHGYFFVSTFVGEHLAHHARALSAPT
jgi:S-formylglutathione hydrolase